jgi:hypothetical protein
MNSTIRVSVAAAVAAATLVTPSVAFAKGGGGGGGNANIASGTCAGTVTYKLKADAKPAGKVGAAFEVDPGVVGQQWRVVLFHNGTRVMRQVFTTAGLSGSFTARQLVPGAAGADSFRARAVRLSDGASCADSVTF